MELAAARTPFLTSPLVHRFGQCFHVDHRLRRYGAGRRIAHATTDPDGITEAIVAELRRPTRSHPVETDGAARAAALLAELL